MRKSQFLGRMSLTPRKIDGVQEISAYDASLVLQHAAGLAPLRDAAAVAAAVDKSGAVTSLDAFYILQEAVGLINPPFPGAGQVWAFLPPDRNYDDLRNGQVGQDFIAILLGDVSRNWSTGTVQLASGMRANNGHPA